jgi:hypothetical protein
MIHYICIATENKLYLPYLKQLIPNLTILGMDMKWKGYMMKPRLVNEYLKTLHKNDIVCVIDAYDVLPTKNIVNLEKKFINFCKKNPNVKMIVGSEAHYNFINKKLSNIIFTEYEGCTINAGQLIGYVENIKYYYNYILSLPRAYFKDNYNDDQIILTKYALSLNNKNEVYIDANKEFFHVVGTKPLQQITIPNSNVCFVHAALNGLMDKFLLQHHNIHISMKDKSIIYKEHLKQLIKKNIYYFNILRKRIINVNNK